MSFLVPLVLLAVQRSSKRTMTRRCVVRWEDDEDHGRRSRFTLLSGGRAIRSIEINAMFVLCTLVLPATCAIVGLAGDREATGIDTFDLYLTGCTSLLVCKSWLDRADGHRRNVRSHPLPFLRSTLPDMKSKKSVDVSASFSLAEIHTHVTPAFFCTFNKLTSDNSMLSQARDRNACRMTCDK